MTFYYKEKTIAYKKSGEGTAVVLLHGFGEDSSIWDAQIDALKNICKLIVPDLPGSGQSAMLGEDEANISLDELADAVYALLQHEQADSCILLGHSMGGYIALAFAEKYPAALLGLGLVHSTAFADSEEKKTNRRKGIDHIKAYGGFSFLKNAIPNLFGAAYKRDHADKIDLLIGQSKQFADAALVQYYVAMMNRPDRTVVLQQSRVPVLFIAGNEDVAAPLEDLLHQVHLPAMSHIHILEGIGHMGMWEATEAINRHLVEYIRSLIHQ